MKIQIPMVVEAGWFDDLTKSAKAEYIKKHPDSKYAKSQKAIAEKLKKPFKIGGSSGLGGAVLHGDNADDDDPSAEHHIAYHDKKASSEKDPEKKKAHKAASALVKKIVKEDGVEDASFGSKKRNLGYKTLRDHHDHVKKHSKEQKSESSDYESNSASSDYYTPPRELINRENGKLRDSDIPVGLEKAIFEKLKTSLAKVPELKLVPKSFWVDVSSKLSVKFTVKMGKEEKFIVVTARTTQNFKKIEILGAEIGRDNRPRGVKSELSGSATVFVPVLQKVVESFSKSDSSVLPTKGKSSGLSLETKLANLDKREAEEIKAIQAKYKTMRANVKKGLPARGERPRFFK